MPSPPGRTSVPSLPTRIGPYEILAELGAGGMGTVWLARRAGAGGFQRLVAIKQAVADADDPTVENMLLDEARIAAGIHHPNVVAIHEVDRDERGRIYLVMDYVAGVAFDQVLRKLPEPDRVRWRMAIRVVLDALEGLHAAHELRDADDRPLHVVHRDVSPHNVLVGIEGTSRVTDFGIAKAASRLAMTRGGAVKGKLSYLSPEQLLGELVEARADLFSAGVVLWEALAARRLFRRDSDAATLDAILRAAIPRVTDVVPTLPADVSAVCERALQREPYLRFASAREMATELERVAGAHSLIATRGEVGEWMARTFGAELSLRRRAMPDAAPHEAKGERTASDAEPIPMAVKRPGSNVPDAEPATTTWERPDPKTQAMPLVRVGATAKDAVNRARARRGWWLAGAAVLGVALVAWLIVTAARR